MKRRPSTRAMPPLVLVLATLAAPPLCADFDILGTLTDADGLPLPRGYVEAWDDNGGPDQLLGTAFADDLGDYQIHVTGPLSEDPDLYLSFDWRFEITAIPATNQFIYVLGTNDANTCGPDPSFVAFAPETTPVIPDHPQTQSTVIDLQSTRALGIGVAPDLVFHLNAGLLFYEDHKGGAPWSLNHHVKVIVGDPNSSNYFCQNDGAIRLLKETILGQPSGNASNVYHELGHMVHFYANGMSLPPGSVSGSHHAAKESSPGFALKEGWPSYVANRTDMLYNPSPDGYHTSYEDLSYASWWGDEAMPTALDGGVWESGEDVEGALGGLFNDLDALHSFEANFRVIVVDWPDSVYAFLQGFAADLGTAPSPDIYTIYSKAQDHGITFTRARFGLNPFLPGPPGNDAPADVGNAVLIDDVTFLRGTLQATVEAVPAADLGVDVPILPTNAEFVFKAAAPGDAEDAQGFPSGGLAQIMDGDVEVVTTSFGGASGDGDWDIALRGAGTSSFDTFTERWDGDGNPMVSSAERALKRLGIWFDVDRDPTTPAGDPDKGGKVVVDNTPPTISNFNL